MKDDITETTSAHESATTIYDDKVQAAQKVYATLRSALDALKWKYSPDDENLSISTSAVGDDLEIKLNFVVSKDRQVFYVKSPLPFRVPQNVSDDFGKALHAANFSMLNGCFEYDPSRGYVAFRIVIPFAESTIGQETCRYMVLLTCQMVDKFNDKLLALVDGQMTLSQFLAFAQN